MIRLKKRKFSIRIQFALIFITMMAAAILICFIFNTLFLGKYYLQKKRGIIKEAYQSIRAAAVSDSYGTDEFKEELEKVCLTYNITICIVDVDSEIRYVSQNGGHQLEAKLFSYIFGYTGDNVQVLEQGEDYQLQITGQGHGDYLEMYGRLTSGISFIMQTPLESIRESAWMANRFMEYVGLLIALIGGVVIWFVMDRITKPIMKLSSISEQMVQLNFEAKYDMNRHPHGLVKDEIDVLGDNINRLSETLEKSISELKTANNELKRDIENKEKIDEMRREFLANVSHELKTPIALIQGYAEGLQEGISEDDASRDYYCEVIVDEAVKMNQMVKRLLTLNELEFGNDVISMERFDLVTLLKNYVQSAMIITQPKGIRVDMPDYKPLDVWADEFMTEEVFMNYFTNAVNHCEGEKRIEIRLETEPGRARVSVFNTGQPIPEEALGYLWDKFYKVDKARTREYGGSGVGLSIVKAIQESMHQQYGVENRADGVLFWFTLETVRTELSQQADEEA
ncbi:MAG: two-component sensor histidine kinase [Lachnospiraceae bacterium]|nr:two-component sensor histidine kinase [Lachnospiraceae bacterium]